jgi:hypothetical protein
MANALSKDYSKQVLWLCQRFSIQARIKVGRWEILPLSQRAAMEEMACTYGYPVDSWDVSHITDMSNLLENKYSFNEYIGAWDVSSVTDTSRMFYGANAFNQNI